MASWLAKHVEYEGKTFDVDITEGDSFLTVECNGNKAYVGVYSDTDKSETYCYSVSNLTNDGLLDFPDETFATIEDAMFHCCVHLHQEDTKNTVEPTDVESPAGRYSGGIWIYPSIQYW